MPAELRLSRFNHGLPRGHAHPEGVQGTAAFPHQLADAFVPEAEAVFDHATPLDTAVAMRDPQPTVMQGLVRPALRQCELLAAGFLGGDEDLPLRQRERPEA